MQKEPHTNVLAAGSIPGSSWRTISAAALAAVVGVLLGVGVVGFSNPFTVLAACCGLLAAGFITARIERGLFLYIFITYAYLSNVAIERLGIPSLAKILIGLLILGIAVRWIVLDERPSGWGRITVVLGVYFLVALVSMTYAKEVDRSLTHLQNLMKDALSAIVMVMLIRHARVLRGALWSLLTAGILMGTVGVYQHLTGSYADTFWGMGSAMVGDIAEERAGYRIGGPIGEPNFFALMLLALIPLAVERMRHEAALLLKLLAAWAAAVCTLALLFTYSRGGFLALILMAVAFLIAYPPKPKVVAAACVVGIPLLFFIPPHYLDRMVTIRHLVPGSGKPAMSDDALRGRKSEMVVALHMFLDHPLKGVGIGNYDNHYQQYARQIYLDARLEARRAHSRFLEVMAETGIIGLTAFCMILGMMFHGLWRARRAARDSESTALEDVATAVGIAMIGVLTASFFLHDDFARFFWLLVGIGFAVPNIVRTETSIPVGA